MNTRKALMSTHAFAKTSLVVLAVVLMGCGGDDNPAAPAPPPPPPPPPPAAQPPADPTALSAVSTGTSTIDLGWTDGSDNEADFRIERGLSSAGPFSEIGTTGANVVVFSDSGLTDETEYCYQVRATNADGTSGFTAVSCATTDAPPPPPPLPDPVTLTADLKLSQIVVDLVEQDCTPVTASTDPATLVWLVPVSQAFAGICDTANIFPVIAPDGQQLTFAEWATATGSVTLTCLEGGSTRFDVNLAGLIPNGVYTIWHFPLGAGGALASHPPVDINNVFVASATGAVNASVVATDGDMTFFGSAASCQLPVPLQSQIADGIYMVLVYHTDNMSWGAGPGPEETGAAHMIVLGL